MTNEERKLAIKKKEEELKNPKLSPSSIKYLKEKLAELKNPKITKQEQAQLEEAVTVGENKRKYVIFGIIGIIAVAASIYFYSKYTKNK